MLVELSWCNWPPAPCGHAGQRAPVANYGSAQRELGDQRHRVLQRWFPAGTSDGRWRVSVVA